MNALFIQAIHLAQIDWPNWQGNVLFSDVVGYYARQIAIERKRRPRKTRLAKVGHKVNYQSKRVLTAKVCPTQNGEHITLKTERPFEFWYDVCDTVNYFAEGRNWPQRRHKTKCTKEAYRRIANDSRRDCRQRVYC